MAYSLEQLQAATLDSIKKDPGLANELGKYYHGFQNGQFATQNPFVVGDWLSGSRDFNYDRQYALRNAASYLGGGDRSNPTVAQYYGDGKLAPKDAPAFYAPPPKPETIGTTFNAGQLGYGTTPTPQLPTPTAATSTLAYANSIAGDLENKKAAQEQAHKNQIDQLQKQIDKSNQAIADYTTLQKNDVLPDIEEQLKPFRENLEKSERERLKVEENYFANQKLTGELESLLTTLQEQIKAEEAVTGLSSIRSPRIAKIKDEVAGRVGVIEAVMSARSGQIAEAYRLIDRSVDAISADRQDRLSYYETLFNFYEGEKDREGKKLLNLEDDKRQFITAQIAQTQAELERSQATADYIKELMVDPQTALMAAQAGITLNDAIETVNAKLSKQLQVEEKSALINDMAAKGYSYAATQAQLVGKAPDQIVSVRDSRGNTLQFVKATDALKPGMFDGLTSSQQTLLNSIINKYNASPLIAAADRTVVLKNVVQQIQKNPENGPLQLSLVYSYIQALDTYQSAVREGELALVNSIDSKAGKISNYVQQIQNGQIVRPEVAKEIAATAQQLVDTISTAAQQKAASFRSQANTFGFGEAWDKYIGGFQPSYGSSNPGTGATVSGGTVSFDSWASF